MAATPTMAIVFPMAIDVWVWSDYVCPWCYVGLTELERLRADYDLAIDLQPFELRPKAPDTGWRLPEHILAKANAPDNPLTQRAQALGIKLIEREWIPSSRRAHECTEYARSEGRLEPFHRAVMKAYWGAGKDIHNWSTLESAAREAALDPAAMRTAVQAGRYRRVVDDRIASARARGLDGVPTFVIGGERVLRGAQEAQSFRAAFENLKRS